MICCICLFIFTINFLQRLDVTTYKLKQTKFVGRDIVVGMVTRYELDSLGIESVYNEQASRKAVGASCSVYVAECGESSS